MFVWSRSEVRLRAVPPTTIESPLTFSPSWMLPRWRRPASVWKTALSICSFTPICSSTFFDSLNPATSSWNFALRRLPAAGLGVRVLRRVGVDAERRALRRREAGDEPWYMW